MSVRTLVARNLRRLRVDRGLSQEELADRADVDRTYISSLEREQYAATIDMLEKLAGAMGFEPIEFFRES
jgi:transcriptional regulator with XRE-family HTH domain